MHGAVQGFRWLTIVAYIALAIVALLSFLRRRDRAAMWGAAAFGSLGLLELLALVPNHSGNLVERAIGRVEIALLVVFPFLLFRFTTVFRTARRDLDNAFFGLTGVLLVWTFAMPSTPQKGESWPVYFLAFVALFLLHWTVLSVLTATRLVLAGRQQPSVARRRMQMLAFASGSITVAIFLAASGPGTNSPLVLATDLLALAAVAAFYLGLAPPSLVRMVWRLPAQAQLQEAISSLLGFAESQEEVAGRVLEPAAALVGARAIAIRNAEGRVVGAWNVPAEGWEGLRRENGTAPAAATEGTELVELDLPGGASLAVWTSPYAPFFGEDELALLRTLGALTGVALDRVRLYQAEHEARIALERANEVKSNFVALAAHELRTPMTTIHGFVTTLHHLGDRLDDEQTEQLRAALVQQTQRMALLIEQLLDLSRLDAEAIKIDPRPLRVREQVDAIVAAAAPEPELVAVRVADDLVVPVDRDALERIVTNLVTNAFRYGEPPVVVAAEQTDRHFRLTVEDCGPGVQPAFVPDLFERFTRSDEARPQAVGTGLGLAIARSYAQAHGGDLLYEDAEPHGARFRLVLPTVAAPVEAA
ncbi:MAG TPA: ATP-binding protein [Gaiellaceae bacterium]|nr:ATP-binding protein [Gaiellaceae bacterium]